MADVLVYASDGPFGSKLKTEHYTDSGARVVRLQNIDDGQFNSDDRAYISDSYYREISRYALKSGDIVVAGLGDETHAVGRACQVPPDLGPAVNKADCFCLRADTSQVEQEYLLHFLNSANARQQVKQRVQGTTRFRINVSNLKSILVPVPDRAKQLEMIQAFQSLNVAFFKAAKNCETARLLAASLRENLLTAMEGVDVQ